MGIIFSYVMSKMIPCQSIGSSILNRLARMIHLQPPRNEVLEKGWVSLRLSGHENHTTNLSAEVLATLSIATTEKMHVLLSKLTEHKIQLLVAAADVTTTSTW